MDVTLDTVARAVRASYYGDEAKRIQRGRHEVKVMVRYPRERRKSMQDFENILINETPVTELANFSFSQGYSEINRVDQKRSITVSADVETGTIAGKIVADFPERIHERIVEKVPGTCDQLGRRNAAKRRVICKLGQRRCDRNPCHVCPVDTAIPNLYAAANYSCDPAIRSDRVRLSDII